LTIIKIIVSIQAFEFVEGGKPLFVKEGKRKSFAKEGERNEPHD
jgi:hypothetical protein